MCKRGVPAVTLTWGIPLRHSDFKAVELSVASRFEAGKATGGSQAERQRTRCVDALRCPALH